MHASVPRVMDVRGFNEYPQRHVFHCVDGRQTRAKNQGEHISSRSRVTYSGEGRQAGIQAGGQGIYLNRVDASYPALSTVGHFLSVLELTARSADDSLYMTD